MATGKQVTVFCAWCQRVIQWGDGGISHGLCEACMPAVAAEIDARLHPRPLRVQPPALVLLEGLELGD